MKSLIDQLVAENPKIAEECRDKPKALGKFIGLARKIDSKVNPKTLNEELHKYFGHEFKTKVKKVETFSVTTFVWVNNETGEEVEKLYGFDPRPWSQIEEDKKAGVVHSQDVIRYYSGGQMSDYDFHQLHTKHVKTTIYGEEKEHLLKPVAWNEMYAKPLVSETD